MSKRCGAIASHPLWFYTKAMRALLLLSVFVALAGCAEGPFTAAVPDAPVDAAEGQTRPQARDDAVIAAARAPKPPPTARTVEEFDTTTAEERAAAASAAPAPEGERKLGETIASLGDVARPGFWLETPLVDAPTMGRIVYPATGKSAQVELIPIDGPSTGGSRISLAAMRLIEAPLTDLPTIEVYAGG